MEPTNDEGDLGPAWNPSIFSGYEVRNVAAGQGSNCQEIQFGEIRVPAGEVVCKNPVFDPNPGHYTRLDPQPIEVCTKWGLPYPLSSAIKYLARAGHKNGEDEVKDLRKAVTFIEWYIGFLQR